MGRKYSRYSACMVGLTRNQVREIDRIAIEQYHIPGIVLMENAALGVVREVLSFIKSDPTIPVNIFCGIGNNGGDGLAIARHLHIAKYKVHLTIVGDSTRYQGDALINWKIIESMKLPVSDSNSNDLPTKGEVVIDALFGTGLTRPVEGFAAECIRWINASGLPVIAVDVPSGLDCDSGEPTGDCVRATKTVTFVAEKRGFSNPNARQYLGEVCVAGIGAPRELIDEVSRR